jgi:hypothetical protein
MPLPIIIEQTARWYWLAVPMAAVPLAVLVLAIASAIKGRKMPRLAVLATMLFLGLWGGWFVMAPVDWQTRIDKDGITVRAPFDPLMSTPGHIDWKDLKEIRFGKTSGRGGSSTFIVFEGKDYSGLELHNLHNYPASFWAALIAAIESNAPQVKYAPDKRTWLLWLKDSIDPETAPFSSFRGYTVRDGDGQLLR